MPPKSKVILGGLCLAAVIAGTPAAALESCAPRDTTAKILASKNPRDIHPEWRGDNSIGLSWSLVNVRQDGTFLNGVLMSPRGGKQPYRVFVLKSEWECS